MKKKFFARGTVLILFLFCFTGRAFAEVHFEISPLYSLRNGCLNELVFYKPEDELFKLSELNWNIKNISYAGGKLAVSSEHFMLETGVLGGFSKSSTKMYDSDWQNLPAAPDVKTTFSISDNTVDSGFNINTKAAFFLNIEDWFQTGIFAKYSFDQIKFSARNGYGWYGSNRYSQNGEFVPYDSEYAKFFAVGSLQGIDYLRVTEMYNFGFFWELTFFDRVQLMLQAGFLPFAVVKSLDHHYSPSGRESYYRDEIKFNFSNYELEADLRLKLFSNLHLGCTFSYNYISLRKGDTYNKQEEHGYTEMIFKDLDEYYPDTTSKSGCSGEWYNLSFYLTYIF